LRRVARPLSPLREELRHRPCADIVEGILLGRCGLKSTKRERYLKQSITNWMTQATMAKKASRKDTARNRILPKQRREVRVHAYRPLPMHS
jgi:hypothetical protein